ncbi:putative uncharacterized protein [Prevotella sp. CAG:924]|nr:putative uncharacterized protein [Prevotella sp. CAG:924]
MNVKAKQFYVDFNEFIKIENASENVIVSPPQTEAPEIKSQGKRISIKLVDSLKANTTYTIDFSSSISDNNEGNPLGNYTYTFSTGNRIDTLEVAGYVINAETLEPVKGVLVGLYDNLSDSAFCKLPMLRVARTDSRGHFIVRGVAPGRYHIFALQDQDGDYRYGQRSEMMGFSDQIIEPTFKDDIRQDTLWKDSLRIMSIDRVHYTHFLPDDVCLRAFNATISTRYLLKSERPDPRYLLLNYSYPDSVLPTIKGLNFDATDAFLIERPVAGKDSLLYWLRDTALVNQDTLRLSVTTSITDTLGVLRQQTDTLEFLSKVSYARRLKEQQKKIEEWQKDQEKKKKRGEPYDSIMPPEALALKFEPSQSLDPDQNITITSPTPLEPVDTGMIHLYSHQQNDSLWYKEPYDLRRLSDMTYVLRASWRPDMEYSLETDSAAFRDIYGTVTKAQKMGLKVPGNDTYASLLITINGMSGKHLLVNLLDKSGNVVKTDTVDNGQAEFYYLKEGDYYVSLIIDANHNGKWDTGDYDLKLQPEQVYFYPEKITCKAKWDMTVSWNPTEKPLYQQKPADITKQKADKEKKIQNRNAQRAAKLGIQYLPQK